VKRVIITIENTGKLCFALVIGILAGALAFLLWAIAAHGGQ
jgi:hypothetical protein